MRYNKITLIDKKDKRYVKLTPKHGKAKQFRYYEGTPLDVYDKLYIDTQKGKYKGKAKRYIDIFMNNHKQKLIKKEEKQIFNKGKRLFKKTPELKSNFMKGTSSTTIPDINKMPYPIQKYYEDLFRPLVWDKDLLKIIANRHNVQKLKHRIQHNITYYDNEGIALGTSSVIGTKEPEMVIQEQKKVLNKYSTLEDSSLSTGSGPSAGFKKMLEEMGYPQYRHYNNGELRRIGIEIIYRN